jgi:DNA-binding transcriptional LysR family regulator
MLNGLIGVEPRHLAALAAVADERSFKAAADRRGYVPSAVRHQIDQLERIVGTPLIERARGTAVELTTAGAMLVPHARRIVAELDAAAADLRTLLRPSGPVRVGVADQATTRMLLAAFRRLATSDPELEVDLCDDGSHRDHLDAVSRGTLDLALGELPVAPAPFGSRLVLADPVVLVLRAGHPLALRRRPPALADLAALPLIVDREDRAFAALDARMRAAGLSLSTVTPAPLPAGVQAMVAAGLGATLVPRTAVAATNARVAVVGLGDLVPPRRVGVSWHPDRRLVSGREAIVDALLAAGGAREAPRFARPQTPIRAAA